MKIQLFLEGTKSAYSNQLVGGGRGGALDLRLSYLLFYFENKQNNKPSTRLETSCCEV